MHSRTDVHYDNRCMNLSACQMVYNRFLGRSGGVGFWVMLVELSSNEQAGHRYQTAASSGPYVADPNRLGGICAVCVQEK